MTIAVFGAGAFGTALAVVLARGGRSVILHARDPVAVAEMERLRENRLRLPGVAFPDGLSVTSDGGFAGQADTALIAVPMRAHRPLLRDLGAAIRSSCLVSCAKGLDLATGIGPTGLIAEAFPSRTAAVLTGPSFAADIGRGLGTALTLACADDAAAERMQAELSVPPLRLYRTDDVKGAEFGGALKNVVAIAAGAVIGAKYGESARAAVVTRGFAELTRLAVANGARAETLMGLAGLGDLILTCTSEQSRNYRFGMTLGAGTAFDPATTVEGVATSHAARDLAIRAGLDVPVISAVCDLVEGRRTMAQVADAFFARPLRRE